MRELLTIPLCAVLLTGSLSSCDVAEMESKHLDDAEVESPLLVDAQARVAPCFDREKAAKYLWDNPEWDARPSSYLEDSLHKIRRFSREELRAMVPTDTMTDASLIGEPYLPQVVDNMLAILHTTLELARETPTEQMTVGQKVRLSDFEQIEARYERHRDALAAGNAVSLPRWFQASRAGVFEEVLRSGKGHYSTSLYPGSFLGSVPESVYGNHYLVLGSEAFRQDMKLNTCGTKLDVTQTHGDWESFIYLGFAEPFVAKQPSYFAAVPNKDLRDDISATSSMVETTRALVADVLAEEDLSPRLRSMWQGLEVVSYHQFQVEHHLLALARTCTPQRASELWLASFSLSDLEISRMDCAAETAPAEQALRTAEPGRVVAQYGEFIDSGLFVLIENNAECDESFAMMPSPNVSDCRYTPATSATGVKRMSCSYPLDVRVPTLYQLQSDWLSPNEHDHARAGLTNIVIAAEDRKRMFQALASGRFDLEPPLDVLTCPGGRPE